jgi:very-short-patch-repair endonuclease
VRFHLLETFAARHHQLVTLDEFRRVGLSKTTWYRALDNELELVHPGVARIVGSARTRQQSIAAAVLGAGRGALASHRSAALLWGVERPLADPLDVILPARTRQATLHGVEVHRPRDLLDLGAVVRDGIPTCNILRWSCDLGAVDRPGVHPAVGHIVTNAMVSPRSMLGAIRLHSRRGRPGVPALREALEDWMADGKFFDSDLERRMRRLIKHYGLAPVEFHAIVEGYEVDFLVVGTRVVLECEGWEHHGKHRPTFERDRVRRAELTVAGYILVEFTWTMLMRQPQWVASMIRGAVRQWSLRTA